MKDTKWEDLDIGEFSNPNTKFLIKKWSVERTKIPILIVKDFLRWLHKHGFIIDAIDNHPYASPWEWVDYEISKRQSELECEEVPLGCEEVPWDD